MHSWHEISTLLVTAQGHFSAPKLDFSLTFSTLIKAAIYSNAHGNSGALSGLIVYFGESLPWQYVSAWPLVTSPRDGQTKAAIKHTLYAKAERQSHILMKDKKTTKHDRKITIGKMRSFLIILAHDCLCKDRSLYVLHN